MTESIKTIAILGGTGDLGTGLARRWVQAGYEIFIGSRTLAKAQVAADDLRAVMSARGISGIAVQAMENQAAATSADLVVVTVPFGHHASTLEQVREALVGKILIDVTVPLVPPKVGTVQLPEGGSAGETAQRLLGDEVRVVSAFQNVAAHHLQGGHELDCDVLVTGNDKDARGVVVGLVEAAGMRGFHAGPIANATAAEALTSVLITINRRYKCHAGIRITGPGDYHD